MKTISIILILAIWLIIGVTIGIALKESYLECFDYSIIGVLANNIILGFTLIVLVLYTWYTYQIAKINSKAYKIEHQPVLNFDVNPKIQLVNNQLMTFVSITNASIYHGNLKLFVRLYLIKNNQMEASDDLKNNNYFNGEIAWPMAPGGAITNTHFSIINNLKPIKSESDLVNYYSQNGQLWMRIKAKSLDMEGNTVQEWSRDWYLQMPQSQLPYEWLWVFEIDQNRLNKLVTVS